MSLLDDHIAPAEVGIEKLNRRFYGFDRDLVDVLQHLLAAVKELDRRQGVTRFPVGE